MKIQNKSHSFLFEQIQEGDMIISKRFKKGFVIIKKIDKNKKHFIFWPKGYDNIFENLGTTLLNNSYLILR